MRQISDCRILYPDGIDWDAFARQKACGLFADSVIEYLDALSGSILKDRECRLYPDVVSFAFFCRKANLKRLQAAFADGRKRLGRGLVFHIAPGNVPVNFGYTLVAGLLTGNVNVVRVSSKQFPQVDIIVRHIRELAEASPRPEAAGRLALVRYDHASQASAFFSSVADVRVIWGGDAAISAIRKSPLPPRAFDVCFSDRYSFALLNPEDVASAADGDIARLSENFYNDTYLFDQNACGSPHLVIWKNHKRLPEAQTRFWRAFHALVKERYSLQPVLAVDKLTAFCRQAVGMPVSRVEMPDNYVVRVKLHRLPENIDTFRCAGGYFSEYAADSLDEIVPIINRRYQTLAYYGFKGEELAEAVVRNRLAGIDRIVPVGQTTAFSLVWDGYNLAEALSRRISAC